MARKGSHDVNGKQAQHGDGGNYLPCYGHGRL
jgi:hypothetical protein